MTNIKDTSFEEEIKTEFKECYEALKKAKSDDIMECVLIPKFSDKEVQMFMNYSFQKGAEKTKQEILKMIEELKFKENRDVGISKDIVLAEELKQKIEEKK